MMDLAAGVVCFNSMLFNSKQSSHQPALKIAKGPIPAVFSLPEPESFVRAEQKKVDGSVITVRHFADGSTETFVRLKDSLKKLNNGRRYLTLDDSFRTDDSMKEAVDAFYDRFGEKKPIVQRKKPNALVPVTVAAQVSDEQEFIPHNAQPTPSINPISVHHEVHDVHELDRVEGELVAHGVGSHIGNEGEKYVCYYADVKTPLGVKRKLGKDLERAITVGQLVIGDYVVLVKTGVEYFESGKKGKKGRRKNYWSAQKTDVLRNVA